MTHEETETHAAEFISKVIESQKRLGHDVKISDQEYRRAVAEAARALAGLSEPIADELAESVAA